MKCWIGARSRTFSLWSYVNFGTQIASDRCIIVFDRYGEFI